MPNGIRGLLRPAVSRSSELPTLRRGSPLDCVCRRVSCDSRVVDGRWLAAGRAAGLSMGGIGAWVLQVWACCLSGAGAERRRAGKYGLQLQFRASASPCVCPG